MILPELLVTGKDYCQAIKNLVNNIYSIHYVASYNSYLHLCIFYETLRNVPFITNCLRWKSFMAFTDQLTTTQPQKFSNEIIAREATM